MEQCFQGNDHKSQTNQSDLGYSCHSRGPASTWSGDEVNMPPLRGSIRVALASSGWATPAPIWSVSDYSLTRDASIGQVDGEMAECLKGEHDTTSRVLPVLERG